jgi:hypothetical protein
MEWVLGFIAAAEAVIIAGLVYSMGLDRFPEEEAFEALPHEVQVAAARACRKVQHDPGNREMIGSNLGREMRRDEASEWAKLYLKDSNYNYSNSDVHLACELYYRLEIR